MFRLGHDTITRHLLLYAALPLAYVITGRLGLLLAVPPGYATAVFVPAGIAVTAMYVAGAATLPGTFLGSFLLNVWIGHLIAGQFGSTSISTAFVIAVASVLQAAIGGAVFRRTIGYPAALDNSRDLLLFLLVSPLICLTSATLSLGGIKALGTVQSADLPINWLTWWVGDTLGVLVALPLILVFAGKPRMLWRSRAWSVAVPMMLCFGFFVVIFVRVNGYASAHSLKFATFSWTVLAAGTLGTGLFGAILMLATGHAYRFEILAGSLRKSEASLRERERELKAIIVQTPFMFLRLTRDLRYRFISQAYAKMIGREPEDVVGKPIVDILGEEAFKTVIPYIEKVLQGDRVEFERQIHYRETGTRLLHVVYTPERDDGGCVSGWLASIVDISEHRRAERLERRLAAIVESSDDAIVSIDLDGVIATWNKAAERLYGYAADEVIGTPITILLPQDRRNEEVEILERIRRGERVEHFETMRRRKDGRLAPVALTVSPVIDEFGKIVGASKIARDITERKRQEEQINLLAREADHRTGNLLALARATVQLADADTPVGLKMVIAERLQALDNAHRLLAQSRWTGADLRELVAKELAPYSRGEDSRVLLDGPALLLQQQRAQAMALAVHELATNAVKYGALSTPEGRVNIEWRLRALQSLIFRWTETDGPRVKASTYQGFGSRVIKGMICDQLKGEFNVDWREEGIICEIIVPM